MRVYAMKARFTGLYEWGKGWLDTRMEETWYDYFRNLDEELQNEIINRTAQSF